MPGAAVAGSQGSFPVQTEGAGGGSGAVVPYFLGTNQYPEKIFTQAYQLTTTTQEYQFNVTPGGFLRGVRLEFRSTGGTGGAATADQPWNVFQSATLENIDGAPIVYPMPGWSHYASSRFFRPWDGDPARRFDAVAGVNPAGTLFIKPEIRHTIGVLANTDARALYRVRFTMNTLANVVTSGTGPTVTVVGYHESWAQPDANDLQGNAIEALPPGINLQTIRRRNILNINAAGNDNQWQLSNMGNQIRGFIAIVRDSLGARQDYLSDPVRWRLDNRSLGVFSINEIFNRMNDVYTALQDGTSVRPTGTYVWPRFFDPGREVGESWLDTTNATYVLFEGATAAGATNLPGTIEWITDEVVPVGPFPAEYEAL